MVASKFCFELKHNTTTDRAGYQNIKLYIIQEKTWKKI